MTTPNEASDVTDEELTTYLNNGWQLTKELRSGKILLTKTDRTTRSRT